MEQKVNTQDLIQQLYDAVPTVYDDSLSFYEVVSKLQYNVNMLTDYVNGVWSSKTDELIKNMLSKAFMNASYDESTETITYVFEHVE